MLADLDAFEKALAEASVDDALHRQIAGRLEVLRTRWASTKSTKEETDFESASDDEMFALLDEELGL